MDKGMLRMVDRNPFKGIERKKARICLITPAKEALKGLEYHLRRSCNDVEIVCELYVPRRRV